jgi:hypothetical protein
MPVMVGAAEVVPAARRKGRMVLVETFIFGVCFVFCVVWGSVGVVR